MRTVVRSALLALAVAAAGFGGGPARASSLAPPARVVAVGDVHGDVDALAAILQRAGLVDANRTWSGKDATLVQLGDMLDRGSHSRAVMDLLMALQTDAPHQGGRVVVLMGNHEAMHVYGDLRYATPADFAAYADDRSEQRRDSAFDSSVGQAGKQAGPARDAWMALHPPGFVEERQAFEPDGRYGHWVRTLPAAVKIGDSIFVHAGISPELSSWTLERINQTVADEIRAFDSYKAYLVDAGLAEPFATIQEMVDAAKVAVDRQPAVKGLLSFDNWLSVSDDGPLWFRGYAEWPDADGAPLAERLTAAFGVARFVVGHTPQPGTIVVRFGGRIYLIDTGMLAGYVPGGRASALEITGTTVTPIYAGDRGTS